MVAEAVVWVDVEETIRAWARDNVASVDRRVFFGVNQAAPFPQIVLHRVGGPDDRCLIQFDCWSAPKGATGGTKGAAAAVAADLCTAIDALTRFVHDGVVILGADKPDARWLPDFESDQPRYVVSARFTVAALTVSGS